MSTALLSNNVLFNLSAMQPMTPTQRGVLDGIENSRAIDQELMLQDIILRQFML